MSYTKASGAAITGSAGLTLGTPTAVSGTAVDFTVIPSTATQVIVSLTGISSNSTSNFLVQIGDSGGIETSGYLGAAMFTSADAANFTTGFGIRNQNGASSAINGSIILTLLSSAANTWSAFGVISGSDGAYATITAGSKSLSPGPLDRVRFTTVSGDTLDAGTINIAYR